MEIKQRKKNWSRSRSASLLRRRSYGFVTQSFLPTWDRNARDEPLRMSAWEAIGVPEDEYFLFSSTTEKTSVNLPFSFKVQNFSILGLLTLHLLHPPKKKSKKKHTHSMNT